MKNNILIVISSLAFVLFISISVNSATIITDEDEWDLLYEYPTETISFDALSIPDCSDVDSANNFEKVYVKPNISHRLCLLISLFRPFMLEFCFRKRKDE